MTFNSPSVESFDNSVKRMPLWRRLAILTSLAIGLFYTARIATKPVPLDAASVESVSEPRTCRIEEITLGMRVSGRNPLRHETSSPSKITPENWRAIHLTMNQNGTEYKLAFLRSRDWLKSASAVQGHTIQFSLPEMGLEGAATVESIQPCPTIEPDDGTGRMIVTGTMRHLAGNAVDLHVTGLDEPIGVTDTHPIWSETRQDFVQAGRLHTGEELRTLNCTIAIVQTVSARHEVPETVFNLEVDGEHVYVVSSKGMLVHNGCMNPDQIALKDLVDEASLGGRKAVDGSDANILLDWAHETQYPKGNRTQFASAEDLAPIDNHWVGGPHMHILGVGSGHVPVGPGVIPQ